MFNPVTGCCSRCGLSRAAYERWVMAAAKSDKALSADAAKLRVQVAMLRDALQWYADPDHYVDQPDRVRTERRPDGSTVTRAGGVPVLLDGGARARRWLEQ